jgi:hypothetical protein
MLRITKRTPSSGHGTLVLEGRLVGPWVEELRQVAGADRLSGDGAATSVELGDLTFADPAGVAYLRQLRDSGVELVGCSGFLAALIGVDDDEDQDVG